jgi:hypothetical protein
MAAMVLRVLGGSNFMRDEWSMGHVAQKIQNVGIYMNLG